MRNEKLAASRYIPRHFINPPKSINGLFPLYLLFLKWTRLC